MEGVRLKQLDRLARHLLELPEAALAVVEDRQVEAREGRVEPVALPDELLPDGEVAGLRRGRVAQLAIESGLEPGDAKLGVSVGLLGVEISIPVEEVASFGGPTRIGEMKRVVQARGKVEPPRGVPGASRGPSPDPGAAPVPEHLGRRSVMRLPDRDESGRRRIRRRFAAVLGCRPAAQG